MGGPEIYSTGCFFALHSLPTGLKVSSNGFTELGFFCTLNDLLMVVYSVKCNFFCMGIGARNTSAFLAVQWG